MLFVPYPVCVALAQACETQQAGLGQTKRARGAGPRCFNNFVATPKKTILLLPPIYACLFVLRAMCIISTKRDDLDHTRPA